MSYDIWLTMDTGGPERATVCDVGNHTSNTSPMWRLAFAETGGDWDALTGSLAGDRIEAIAAALGHMRDPDNRAAYEAMNPSNGWGSHASATRYIETLLDACSAHPLARIEVSR